MSSSEWARRFEGVANIIMVDERYVRYKGYYKKKHLGIADHVKKYQFQKGESGLTRVGKKAVEKDGKIVWEKTTPPVEDTPPYPEYPNLHPQPPWKPGQSGNAKGRPIGSISVVERLKAYLRRHPEEMEKIVETLVKEGRLGNMIATKEILDRVDGKVTETHKIEGELPIRIEFVPAYRVLGRDQDRVIEGQAREIKELGEGEEQNAQQP